jgi:diguanylate cyclase (GGDEF)-like protein
VSEPRSVSVPLDSHDLNGLVRRVAFADVLVLALVLAYQIFTPSHRVGMPLGVAMVLFVAAGTAVRLPKFTRAYPTLALEAQAWAMIGFITAASWFSGGADSPLDSLYLLPIVLAALVLRASRLGFALFGVAVACLTVVSFSRGAALPPAAVGARLLLVLAPLVLVAWLTAQLGNATLSARRRAAALVDGDALTGLATRRVFLESLQREFGDSNRRDQACAVLVIDLDGSRRINELYGHEAGNAALRLVAEALRRTIRDTDVAARAGGDEFAVLLRGATAATSQVAAQRIRHAVNTTTLEAGARVLRCSVSIGAAAAPRDGRDAAALLATAERRLDQDRELRRGAANAALQA